MAEDAAAHTVRNKVEVGHHRADLLGHRGLIMQPGRISNADAGGCTTSARSCLHWDVDGEGLVTLSAESPSTPLIRGLPSQFRRQRGEATVLRWVKAKFAVAVTDFNMGDSADGVMVAARAAVTQPQARVMLVSGLQRSQPRLPEKVRFLPEPYRFRWQPSRGPVRKTAICDRPLQPIPVMMARGADHRRRLSISAAPLENVTVSHN